MIIDINPIYKNGQVSLTGSRKKADALLESDYKPNDATRNMTLHILQRFSWMNTVKQKPYRELNNMSPMERQSVDQIRFNSYQFYQSGDPDDDWKSNAVRPITRNRVISIAAHITQNIMVPNIFAENEQNEDDKDSAMVMKDLVEWTLENSKPEWERTFLFAVLAALVNPIVFVHTEYAEVYRTVKVEEDDGPEVPAEEGGEAAEKHKYTTKKILDEEYSGFIDTITPLDEMWWPDMYQYDFQRQPDYIRRRVITYEEAQGKYGDHENWKYVRPGIQTLFVEATNLFYQAYDQNLRGNLVEEIIYGNRGEDLELKLVNGVMVTDPDRPNPRMDKKYPYWTMGYEIVDEGKFCLHKSLVNKLGPDEEVVQTLYRMIIDGTYLQLYQPLAVFGDEAVDAGMIAPGLITNLSQDTKVQGLLPQQNNLPTAQGVLDRVEASMTESSIRDLQQGPRMTAFAVQAIEAQIQTLLGLFGRMIGFGIKSFADLRINDILQYMTVGDAYSIMSETDKLKFGTFILNDKMVDGKKKTRKITMKPDIFGKDEVTPKEKLDYEFGLLKKGGLDTEIVEVDPDLFRKRKFKTRVTHDILTPKTDVTRKALALEEYDRAIANPLANQEAVYRDLLLGAYDMTKGDPDKYINKQPQNSMGAAFGANPINKPGVPTVANGTPGSGQPAMAQGNSAVAMMANQRAQESAAQLIKR